MKYVYCIYSVQTLDLFLTVPPVFQDTVWEWFGRVWNNTLQHLVEKGNNICGSFGFFFKLTHFWLGKTNFLWVHIILKTQFAHRLFIIGKFWLAIILFSLLTKATNVHKVCLIPTQLVWRLEWCNTCYPDAMFSIYLIEFRSGYKHVLCF